MKQADVNTGDILWTRASGIKVQVRVLKSIQRASMRSGRLALKFEVQNLRTERTILRSAGALHKTRDFEET